MMSFPYFGFVFKFKSSNLGTSSKETPTKIGSPTRVHVKMNNYLLQGILNHIFLHFTP